LACGRLPTLARFARIDERPDTSAAHLDILAGVKQTMKDARDSDQMGIEVGEGVRDHQGNPTEVLGRLNDCKKFWKLTEGKEDRQSSIGHWGKRCVLIQSPFCASGVPTIELSGGKDGQQCQQS
jgi:hypothetical protein